MTGIQWGTQLDNHLKKVGSVGAGQVFTYDSAGGADFEDLQEAIDACEDWRGDTIIVKAGSHQLDELVTIDKNGITIKAEDMGGPPEALGERFTILGDSDFDDGPPVKITNACTIKGIGFTTRNASSGDKESAGLHIEGAGSWNGFVHLLNCRFSCWYGAQEYGIYFTGGPNTRIETCTFDGLFGGFGTAAIGLDDNGEGTTPDFIKVIDNNFDGLGSGIPAVQFQAGGIPNSFLMLRNVNNPGFGTRGTLLDNASLAAEGIVAENYTGLANKAAAFVNLTNSLLAFQDNHYNE